MGTQNRTFNCIVAALLATVMFSLPSLAEEGRMDQLFASLQEADPADARRIAGEIELEWSKSGSATADLLLKRGTDALDAGEVQAAIEHFTALTDHAPDFGEGWYMRSVAYAQAELFGPAIADIERVLELEPRHYNAIASLGGILAQVDRPEQAKDAFSMALAIHPHHEDVSEALEHVERLIGGREL
jgi:tetratricopeptide (TPR) repeat protein